MEHMAQENPGYSQPAAPEYTQAPRLFFTAVVIVLDFDDHSVWMKYFIRCLGEKESWCRHF